MKFTLKAASVLVAFITTVVFVPAYCVQNDLLDSNIDVSFNYPNFVTQGNEFIFATTVKATADQVSNVTITVSSPQTEIPQNQFHIVSLPKDSTLGNNFDVKVKDGTPDGVFLLNVEADYYMKGFFDQKPVKYSITKAVEINASSKPQIILDASAPQEVFTGESFSIKGTITNQGSDAQNIQLVVNSPQINLDGQKTFSLTNLNAGDSSNFELVLQVSNDLSVPTHAIINLNGTYSDKSGKQYDMENSLNVYARHRGMLEIGEAQGIWLGNFFIAPVVGIGTIVSSVIGFFMFMWHYKNKKRQKRKK